MAGEFNLYSQYAQTQAPISQFVPDSMPWELILKQGAQKQATQDLRQGELKAAADDLKVPAWFPHEQEFVQKKKQELQELAREGATKDFSSGTEFYDFVNRLKAIKEDPTLGTISSNYQKMTDFTKHVEELKNKSKYGDWNAMRALSNINNYSDSKEIKGLSDLTVGEELDRHAKKQSYFNDAHADTIETLGKLANSDLWYSTTTENLLLGTAKDPGKLRVLVDAAYNDYITSPEGKQEGLVYEYYKANNPNLKISKEDFIKQSLLQTAAEKAYHKKTSTLENALNIGAGWNREDKNKPDVGVIREGGNLTQGVDFTNLDDLDSQISAETDSSKKQSLINLKNVAVSEFNASEEGKIAKEELTKKLNTFAFNYMKTSRINLNSDDLKFLKDNGVNIDDFVRSNAGTLIKSSSYEDVLKKSIEVGENLKRKLKAEGKSEQIIKTVTAVLSKLNNNSNNGSYDIQNAFRDYNSAFEKSMAGKSLSIGEALTASNPELQNEINKNFNSAYEVSDWSVIGQKSSSKEEAAILDKIKLDKSATIKLIDNKSTNAQEFEVTYLDEDVPVTTRIIAKTKNGQSTYATIAKKLGKDGQGVEERNRYSHFVPPMDKAVKLNTEDASISKKYEAMTNKDGNTMSLYKVNDKGAYVPVSFGQYITTVTKDVAHQAMVNEIYKYYGDILESTEDPRINKIIEANSIGELSTEKVNGVSDQDIYNTIIKQPYIFDNKASLFNVAKSLK